MSGEELILALSYACMTPTFLYFAFVHWNRGERVASAVLGGLSLFFLLLMTGLVLVDYVDPFDDLLVFNTAIAASTALGSLITVYEFRSRRKRTSAQWSELDDVIEQIERLRQGESPGR